MKKLSTSILLILSIIFAASVSVGSQAWFPDGLQSKGSVTIGEKATADSKAVLDVRSTTKGFLPPRMTTTQRDAIASPPAGLIVYNTTTNKLNQYNGTAWGEVAGSGSSGAQYNTLTNYNFEDTTYSTGWTASGGTLAAAAGTNILFGTQSATWDSSSAGQTLSYDAITIGQGYKGNNCEGAIYVQTPSGTATHLIEVYDGTNVLVSGTVITSTTSRQTTVNFPCPSSGTMQLRLKSVAADEPLIAIDDAYLGLARNVGSTQLTTEWASWTPTGSWTTNTTYTGRWRQVGDTAEIQVRIALSGAPTAATLTVNLPSGFVIDTSKLAGGTTQVELPNSDGSMRDDASYNGFSKAFYDSTTTVGIRSSSTASAHTLVIVTATTPITWAANDSIDVTFRVPIVGWRSQTTASIDAISKRGSAYFATGNATTTSGSAVAFNNASFSSPTLEGQALAPTTANDVGIRMAGAPAGVYEVNAVGWFYAYRASGETGTNCAYDLYDGTNSRGGAIAGAPNVAGVSTLDGIGSLSGTFTLSSAGTINVVLRGQRTSGTGACYVDGPISISIKNVSQNSPAIVLPLSVSSALSNGAKIVTAKVQALNGSTCTVSEEDGSGTAYDWLGSTTPIAIGRCTVAINAGVFSATPKCFIEPIATTYTGVTQSLASHFSALSTTSMTLELRYDTGGSNAISGDDSPMMVMCFGAR